MMVCKAENETVRFEIYSENLRFNEGTVVYDSSLLISNFGTKELNPLGEEGKGYITKLHKGKIEMFIKADGHLNSPKGMAIHDNKLYVADVNKVLIYNLKNTELSPITIKFPKDNLFVNDIVVYKNNAYISVTNTGKIFKLDLFSHELIEYTVVPGANGLFISNDVMYVASYPANGIVTNNNVIYLIQNIDHPKPIKFIDTPGQYDGLALHHNKLYFTNWINGEIGYINISNKEITTVKIEGLRLKGPADISILNNELYIPDLPESRIIQIKL